MKETRTSIVVLTAFTCIQLTAPAAVVMNVDVDNAAGGPTQAGYTQCLRGATKSIAGIDVLVSATTGRDRGDFTNPIADLARDFVYTSASITLGSVANPLPAGLYKFTGYHHDKSNAISSGNYTVTDEERTSELVLSSRGTGGSPANAEDIATQEIYIRSDGVNPVTISLYGINGFDLETATAPEELKIDNYGAAYVLQSGFQAYDTATENLEVHYYTQAGNDDVMSVQYTISGHLTRNAAVTHELADLLYDYLIRSGGDITITLRGLKAGTVTMSTYHHGGHAGTYDILVGAATAVSGVSSGSGDNPTITEFQFQSDGASDVVVTLDNVSGYTMLNGFKLAVAGDAGMAIVLR